MLFLGGTALLLWEGARWLQDGAWPNFRFGDFWILYLHWPIPVPDGSRVNDVLGWFMRQRPSVVLTVIGIILAGWANHRAKKARQRLEPA
jgi:hypothetical protein